MAFAAVALRLGRPGLIALLLSCFMLAGVEARTRIYVQNNTSLSFEVRSSQTGTALRGDRWGQVTSRIEPGQRTEVVWFNRGTGITSGREFFFSTVLLSGGSSISLKQRLRGTTFHSTMWQSLEGPGISHPWFNDRNTHSATWNIAGRALVVKYRAYFTGGDDDIEYILQETYQVDSGGPETFNILSYNIYMRPTTLFLNGQMIRARLLPSQLRGYDAIIFQEAFDDPVRAELLRGLRTEYPFRTRILGSDSGLRQDGGVIIVSRWPIEAEDQRLFGGVCSGSDCLADKGVLYARINKGGRRYHVFGTHTQANVENRAVRERQLSIIKSFVDAKRISTAEPVIIGGDLNVNMYNQDEYEAMKRILDVTHPRRLGHDFTFDATINDLASGRTREYLDYVLYSNAHLRPRDALNEVRLLRAEKEWKEFFFETARWDLSDHFPVYGRFVFPRAIREVPHCRPQPGCLMAPIIGTVVKPSR